MIEVELKFRVPSEARTSLLTKLEMLPSGERLGRVENVDIYYDTANFDCLRQAVFLRIRNHAQLDIKYHEQADPTHTHCTEQTFPLLSDPLQTRAMNRLCARFLPEWRHTENVVDALHANGLRAFAHLRNQRLRYAYERLALCVDHVPGLGDFFEVEALCQQECKVAEAQTVLHNFVNGLELPALYPVQVGYVELWLRLHLPQVYQSGIYKAGEVL